MGRVGRSTRIKRALVTEQDEVRAKAEAIGVPMEQIERGHHVIADVRIVEDERTVTHRTLMNRGGTAIERWLHAIPAVFMPGEKAAIKYCQALWAKIDFKGGTPNEIRINGRYLWIGQAEHEARAELAKISERVPYWSIFEDVCRFHSSAADAGVDLASNSRSSIDGAKYCTKFVAATVAIRLGLT